MEDIEDKNVETSLVTKLFGDHSDPEKLPHFLLVAFEEKHTSKADLDDANVIHGFVEGNKIVRLAVDWNADITAQQVAASMAANSKTNSCVELPDEAEPAEE